MKRDDFIRSLALATLSMTSLSSFAKALDPLPEEGRKMPVIFVGHGAPWNAVRDNIYTRTWKTVPGGFEKPNAILVVSAHWETYGTAVTAMEKPQTIHDHGPFGPDVDNLVYPAPGSPEYAHLTAEAVKAAHVIETQEWGLDHGTWSILNPMFPKADIPVFQLSLDVYKNARQHYDIGKELNALRRKGVLIVGSGNIVHNLGMIAWNGGPYDWCVEFDALVKNKIEQHDHDALIAWESHGRAAKLAVNSAEHYLPMLYILGAREEKDHLTFFNEVNEMGSVSMRSFILQ